MWNVYLTPNNTLFPATAKNDMLKLKFLLTGYDRIHLVCHFSFQFKIQNHFEFVLLNDPDHRLVPTLLPGAGLECQNNLRAETVMLFMMTWCIWAFWIIMSSTRSVLEYYTHTNVFSMFWGFSYHPAILFPSLEVTRWLTHIVSNRGGECDVPSSIFSPPRHSIFLWQWLTSPSYLAPFPAI